MICPHCQKQLPANYDSPWCPYCGQNLSVPGVTATSKFNWRLFLIALLGPPLLTLVAAAVMRFVISPTGHNESISVVIGLVGGVVGGFICGALTASQATTFAARAVLFIVMSGVMIIFCITLCCFGCNLGGYNLRVGG